MALHTEGKQFLMQGSFSQTSLFFGRCWAFSELLEFSQLSLDLLSSLVRGDLCSRLAPLSPADPPSHTLHLPVALGSRSCPGRSCWAGKFIPI